MKHLQNILESYVFQTDIFETLQVEKELILCEKFFKSIKAESVVFLQSQPTTSEW